MKERVERKDGEIGDGGGDGDGLFLLRRLLLLLLLRQFQRPALLQEGGER